MPKRDDIKSILIIGAGPIVIGQACEFDYSGTQACKALKEEGYRIILLNSNPATIMTDPGLADATYVEPITAEAVKIILEKENPDAILPTMGGQTALNTALTLAKDGTLEHFRVELIGANLDAIEKAEDRLLFREAMDRIGLESPISHLVSNEEEGAQAVKDIGLPAILRPSFTLAGTGGGIAYNIDEFNEILRNALRLSPVGTVLIEESVLGWKEFEMEVVRDKNDNCIIVCSIENVDPMGIHTGDSVTVAPALTLTDKEYQRMRTASIEVLREIGVDTGGSNVQFAVNPHTGRLVVIEMNPKVSRSSALVISENTKIIIVEGNYLLLDQEPWRKIHNFFDTTIMIDCNKDILEKRLIERWESFGLPNDQIKNKVYKNDLPNGLNVISKSISAEFNLIN